MSRASKKRARKQSGYTLCPCCGYDTISDDVTRPELCSDCEDAGCEPDGSEPRCAEDFEPAEPTHLAMVCSYDERD